MPFFYRRKPKPPKSTVFIPLLKLFKTTHRKEPKDPDLIVTDIPLDSGSPILLSGPKSKYGLGISLHFIIIPEAEKIDKKLVWRFARQEMRNALILEGIEAKEADLFAHRLIDPINLPPEISMEYSPEDYPVLEALQRLTTYQLLQGKRYTGSIESLSEIYTDLADTFISLAVNQVPSSSDAKELFRDVTFRNIEVTISQIDIQKQSIVDVEGKLKEIATFFDLFSKKRYLSRVTPQNPQVIQRLYPAS
ncbi:MAG: hypothetical protein Q6361_05720 [Candidatus Hermodarchaeota archaeon]|nr:hypothetical protein [Candidatus Hermodarchaeota archaeon]